MIICRGMLMLDGMARDTIIVLKNILLIDFLRGVL